VIGIHSAISLSVAENFHVPVTVFYEGWSLLAKKAEEKIRADRPEAYVGVEGADDSDGCRVTVVDEDGPAAKAGLKVGDVVVKVEGREVRVYASLLRWVAESEPGDTLSLQVKRGTEVLSLQVKLAAKKADRR
jgi:serine protease Do